MCMFTEFEIISICISFLAGFIILCLHERWSIYKSERDMYYQMFTSYKGECMELLTKNRELEEKYDDYDYRR